MTNDSSSSQKQDKAPGFGDGSSFAVVKRRQGMDAAMQEKLTELLEALNLTDKRDQTIDLAPAFEAYKRESWTGKAVTDADATQSVRDAQPIPEFVRALFVLVLGGARASGVASRATSRFSLTRPRRRGTFSLPLVSMFSPARPEFGPIRNCIIWKCYHL
jgi:hypothetical protein